MSIPVIETCLKKLRIVHRGKVRDVYDSGEDLVLISTDRLSAFDYVLKNPIPDKGKILTALSCHWFEKTRHLIPNHLISTQIPEGWIEPDEKSIVEGRSMRVKKAKRLDVEAIVRGYLTGSAFKAYQETGQVNGIKLPSNLRDGDAFAEPLFTPSTKAEIGEHDEPMTFDQVVAAIGGPLAEKMRAVAIAIFKEAAKQAQSKGLILVDTKMEFGIYSSPAPLAREGDGPTQAPVKDQMILIDELITPDSSRFWLEKEYVPGAPLNPWDKQLVRDYLLKSDWDRKSPPPALPEEIIQETFYRYKTIAEKLMG